MGKVTHLQQTGYLPDIDFPTCCGILIAEDFMKVCGKHYKTIWMKGPVVFMIEQNRLPFHFGIIKCKNYRETCHAIRTMVVRGAGAIGAAAGFAMAQAFIEAPQNKLWDYARRARAEIEATRPTAQNLFYALSAVFNFAKDAKDPKKAAVKKAQELAWQNEEEGRKTGKIGARLIKNGARIGTHCNAGWLAFVDYGSALAPIYRAAMTGKKIFVYVDETRPRNQGAMLTAWELSNEKIPHAIIADNAVAHLMSQGKIDMMIVGADRVSANGDVANKIGTLEKAVCAKEFGVPFYVAANISSFDLKCRTGKDIIIEERSEEEVLYQKGITKSGRVEIIRVSSPGSHAINPSFDVTPGRYITGIITERGIVKADKAGVGKLFR